MMLHVAHACTYYLTDLLELLSDHTTRGSPLRQLGRLDRRPRTHGLKPSAARLLPFRVDHAAHPEILAWSPFFPTLALQHGHRAVVVPADTFRLKPEADSSSDGRLVESHRIVLHAKEMRLVK